MRRCKTVCGDSPTRCEHYGVVFCPSPLLNVTSSSNSNCKVDRSHPVNVCACPVCAGLCLHVVGGTASVGLSAERRREIGPSPCWWCSSCVSFCAGCGSDECSGHYLQQRPPRAAGIVQVRVRLCQEHWVHPCCETRTTNLAAAIPSPLRHASRLRRINKRTKMLLLIWRLH